MNFVAQLEEHLRDLGAEARKKHPGVKEASERAILKLRSLQNEYVSAVRKASANGEKHPDTTIFRSSDLLHPFLLAANYPNASPRLLDTSFRAMKMLMEADAICPGDGMNLVRVWMIQAQVVVSYSTKEASPSISAPSKSTTHSLDTVKSTSPTIPSQSTGSWLGAFLSTSASSSDTAKATNAVAMRTAVSSSHGQAGSGHLNAKDLEKLALDILRCLLQLLELSDLPVTTEQWIQSVTLCCLLCLPLRQTVRQAAHSTLPQVLSLLVKDKEARDLTIATWEDLLTCTMGFSQAKSKKQHVLHGAFSHCRLGEKDAAQPPSPSLSLDLMTTLLKEAPFVFSHVGQTTLGMLVQELQNQSNNKESSPIEFVRVLQFLLVVLQTQAVEWPTECRELVSRLARPIPVATEAIRKQAEFEDGFSYKAQNSSLQPASNLETLRGLPDTVLWKAALSLDTLKFVIQDKSLQHIWLHPEVTVHLLEAASDFCTIGASCEDHMNQLVLTSRLKENNLVHMAESLSALDHWKKGKNKEGSYVLGDALWIGLNVMLKMIDGLDTALLGPGFAPSLAVLQHYLKRFPGSGTVVKKSLEGYFSLARVSVTRPLTRRTLLASLCKLSLPRWGAQDTTCELRDHHVATLICLLNVVHRYYDSIGTEWSIVLQTFQELSGLAIASSQLSDNAYVGALSISAVYSRFAAFSTCLSDRSLSDFAEGVKEASVLLQTTSVAARPFDSSAQDERETIGEKIMSIGVRAIYGAGDGSQPQEDVPLAERTKNTFAHDYQMEFSRRVGSSKHPIRADQVPFTAALFVDLAMTNSYRNNRCGATLLRGLCSLASEVAAARQFVVDAVAMLIISTFAGDGSLPTNFTGPGRILHQDPRQNQYFAVEAVERPSQEQEDLSQGALLAPLCEWICSLQEAAAAEAGVDALLSILESCGHRLNHTGWIAVVESVASLPSADRSSEEWLGSFLAGFRCLKLIVDDFSEHSGASTKARSALLDCCAAFGSSLHDVNISLTAIGLLWTIADQDAGTDSIDLALSKLVTLSSDGRSEVRNCSVNTLFSCIVGRGQAFTDRQWQTCICDMILRVYDQVTLKAGGTDDVTSPPKKDHDGRKSRYRVSVHHSRDSAGKQWVATQALVLRGLCRVLRSFFSRLLYTTDGDPGVLSDGNDSPWFDDAWSRILGFAFEASTLVGGRDTLDLRSAGVEMLVLCNQLSCKAGIQAAITPARVGTNMEVVNGALRSVRSPEKTDGTRESPFRSHSDVTEMWRNNLFLDAFDVLDSFREHLEMSSSHQNEAGQSPQVEPTQIQVLSKFAVDLGKLYECCKDVEFKEDTCFDHAKSFDQQLSLDPTPASDGDPVVSRFVRLIGTVAMTSASSPDSRFLSQAQRACLDILRSMANDGSPEAFIALTKMSGRSFFYEDHGTILAREASTIVHEEFSGGTTSHEGRVLILCRMIDTFLLTVVELEDKSPMHANAYKLFVPIITVGLSSAREVEDTLAEQPNRAAKFELLNYLWKDVCVALASMLSPVSDASNALTIRGALDLVEFVKAASFNAPPKHREGICAILLSGASKCLEIAETNAGQEGDHSRGHCLRLFSACYEGVCRLQPRSDVLSSISKQVLSATLEGGLDGPNDEDLITTVYVQACLMMCQVMQEVEGIEVVAIAVFPLLCQLVGVENAQVRRAVGGVLSRVDVARMLNDSEARSLEAEQRARTAESKVAELAKEVVELQQDRDALQRQLAMI